jgi:hypothetical protein
MPQRKKRPHPCPSSKSIWSRAAFSFMGLPNIILMLVGSVACSSGPTDGAEESADELPDGYDAEEQVGAELETGSNPDPASDTGTLRQAITGQQRVCYVHDTQADWTDVLVVTTSWTETDCANWGFQVAGGGEHTLFMNLGCLTENGVILDLLPFGC